MGKDQVKRIAPLIVPLKRFLIRHPGVLLYIAIAGVLFYAGIRYQLRQTAPLITETARATSRETIYQLYEADYAPQPLIPRPKPKRDYGFTFDPFLAGVYTGSFRAGLGLEIGRIRSLHADIQATFPVEGGVSSDDLSLGIGLSTPVFRHTYVGAGIQQELSGERYGGVYVKIKF